jgi:uncharacterized protein YbaR (Trm112 family)
VDSRLLEILVCPICKAPLDYRKSASELVCTGCRLAYAIKDDIPVMLEDQARALGADES